MFSLNQNPSVKSFAGIVKSVLLLSACLISPILTTLPHQLQFVDDIAGATQFVDAPQYIPNIYTDGSVEVLVEGDFMAEGFVISVKSQANQIAAAIDDRASAIAAGNVVGGNACFDGPDGQVGFYFAFRKAFYRNKPVLFFKPLNGCVTSVIKVFIRCTEVAR